jgi:hypothetical protein
MENVQIAAAYGAQIDLHDGICVAQEPGIVVAFETDVPRAVINESLHAWSDPDFISGGNARDTYFKPFLASSS